MSHTGMCVFALITTHMQNKQKNKLISRKKKAATQETN